MQRVTGIWLAATIVFLFGCTAGAAEPSDAQIRQTMIDDSIKAYQGACPCPYSVDRGNKCAEHSAYRTPGGVRPKCFPSDISDKQVADKRKDLAAKGAAKK